MGVRRDAAAAARWEALAAEAFLGITEWRLQQPRATFQEIEQALDARLAALRARLLQDVALASAAAAVRAREPADVGGGHRVAAAVRRPGVAARVTTASQPERNAAWTRAG